MKKLKWVNPTRTVEDLDGLYRISCLETNGKVDKDYIWLEVKIDDEVWDNSEWLLSMLKTVYEYRKEGRKGFKDAISNNVEHLDKQSLEFITLNRKSLVESYKYIKKYWL